MLRIFGLVVIAMSAGNVGYDRDEEWHYIYEGHILARPYVPAMPWSRSISPCRQVA